MIELLGKIGGFFLDIIETIVVALAIFVVIYLFLFQPHQVKGSSMKPNFHDGEYLLTDKVTYRFRKPKRGEVVIFKSPQNPELDFIKRVIGLPGESVKVENGKVYVNGKILPEPYLSPTTTTQPGAFLKEGKVRVVSQNHLIVFGDNRNHSSDSREWGEVEITSIIGKAFFRYWPPKDIGLVVRAHY